jgi:hypothetical protein
MGKQFLQIRDHLEVGVHLAALHALAALALPRIHQLPRPQAPYTHTHARRAECQAAGQGEPGQSHRQVPGPHRVGRLQRRLWRGRRPGEQLRGARPAPGPPELACASAAARPAPGGPGGVACRWRAWSRQAPRAARCRASTRAPTRPPPAACLRRNRRARWRAGRSCWARCRAARTACPRPARRPMRQLQLQRQRPAAPAAASTAPSACPAAACRRRLRQGAAAPSPRRQLRQRPAAAPGLRGAPSRGRAARRRRRRRPVARASCSPARRAAPEALQAPTTAGWAGR